LIIAWRKKFKEIKMFKRFSIGALVITVLVLGVVGTVLARSNNTPPVDDFCSHEEQACGDIGTSGGHHGMMHDVLADALGMTAQELYAAMSDGQTIAELAAAQGVELDDLLLEMPHVEHMKDSGANHVGGGMMEGGTQSGHLYHQDGHCSDSTYTPTQPGE